MLTPLDILLVEATYPGDKSGHTLPWIDRLESIENVRVKTVNYREVNAQDLMVERPGLMIGTGVSNSLLYPPDMVNELIPYLDASAELNIPVFVTCASQQAEQLRTGGELRELGFSERGNVRLYTDKPHPLLHDLPDDARVAMDHRVVVSRLGIGHQRLAHTAISANALTISDDERRITAQFHSEQAVHGREYEWLATETGLVLLRNIINHARLFADPNVVDLSALAIKITSNLLNVETPAA